jgi:hypothetical protein
LLILWLPSDVEIDFDRWRSKLDDKDRRRWDEWGAQVHFLYCAAWATSAAFVFGRYVAGPPNCSARRIFWVLFSITFIAGIVSNFRLLYSIASEKSSAAKGGDGAPPVSTEDLLRR